MPNNPKYKQAFTGKIAVIAHFSKITLPAVKIVQKKKKEAYSSIHICAKFFDKVRSTRPWYQWKCSRGLLAYVNSSEYRLVFCVDSIVQMEASDSCPRKKKEEVLYLYSNISTFLRLAFNCLKVYC